MIVFQVRLVPNTVTYITTVTLTPTAPTPRARSTARVIRDTLEMESRVWVSKLIISFPLEVPSLVRRLNEIDSKVSYHKGSAMLSTSSTRKDEDL